MNGIDGYKDKEKTIIYGSIKSIGFIFDVPNH